MKETWRYAVPKRPTPVHFAEEHSTTPDPVYGLDFKNYTIGRLVPDRSNYDFDHPDYQEVLSWIRGRVIELGWSLDRFDSVDRTIDESRWRSDIQPDLIEAYAKKYGWIGFFEAAGRLDEENRLDLIWANGRLSDVPIDPSFPVVPTMTDMNLPEWLSGETPVLQDWVTQGNVEIPDELLRTESLDKVPSQWVALDGFLEQGRC